MSEPQAGPSGASSVRTMGNSGNDASAEIAKTYHEELESNIEDYARRLEVYLRTVENCQLQLTSDLDADGADTQLESSFLEQTMDYVDSVYADIDDLERVQVELGAMVEGATERWERLPLSGTTSANLRHSNRLVARWFKRWWPADEDTRRRPRRRGGAGQNVGGVNEVPAGEEAAAAGEEAAAAGEEAAAAGEEAAAAGEEAAAAGEEAAAAGEEAAAAGEEAAAAGEEAAAAGEEAAAAGEEAAAAGEEAAAAGEEAAAAGEEAAAAGEEAAAAGEEAAAAGEEAAAAGEEAAAAGEEAAAAGEEAAAAGEEAAAAGEEAIFIEHWAGRQGTSWKDLPYELTADELASPISKATTDGNGNSNSVSWSENGYSSSQGESNGNGLPNDGDSGYVLPESLEAALTRYKLKSHASFVVTAHTVVPLLSEVYRQNGIMRNELLRHMDIMWSITRARQQQAGDGASVVTRMTKLLDKIQMELLLARVDLVGRAGAVRRFGEAVWPPPPEEIPDEAPQEAGPVQIRVLEPQGGFVRRLMERFWDSCVDCIPRRRHSE